jgi:hypothetical protein
MVRYLAGWLVHATGIGVRAALRIATGGRDLSPIYNGQYSRKIKLIAVGMFWENLGLTAS